MKPVPYEGFDIVCTDRLHPHHESRLQHESLHITGEVILDLQFDVLCVHVKREPKPEPWNGEGLPPVGTNCEFVHVMPGNQEWRGGDIRYISEHTVVISVDNYELVYHQRDVRFRPIRTPEQIAADKRKSVVDDLVRVATEGLPMTITRFKEVRETCERLYDSGLLQEVKP